MKKTFKGYSALIALLIALLVVTSMPMLAFAVEDHDEKVVTYTDANGVVQSHKVNGTPFETQDPTCTEPGFNRFYCLEPNHAALGIWHEEIIPATGHYWDSEYDLDASGNPVAAKDEVWGIVEDESDCVNGGIAYDYCLICGTVDHNHSRDIDELGHTYVMPIQKFRNELTIEGAKLLDKNGKVTTDPDAVVAVTLPDDYADYEEYYADLFEWIGFGIDQMPTCVKDGKAYFICDRCGIAHKDVTIKHDASKEWSHDWDGWVVEKEETCKEKGSRIRWCKICGSKQKQEIPVFDPGNAWEPDHQRVMVESILVNCYTENQTWQCPKCKGKVHEDQVITKPVRSHVYDTTKAELIAKVVDKDGKAVPYTFKDGVFDLGDCGKSATAYFYCVHYKDGGVEAQHTAEGDAALKKVPIPARDHVWGDWILRYQIGAGDNEYAYYIRECSVCGKTDELITKDDPRTSDVTPVDEKPVVVEREFAVDASAVKDGTGKAKVEITEGSAEGFKPSEVFGRVTWVYELSDGSTFAYAAMAPVTPEKDGTFTISVGGAMTPRGATLVETQVALTDDADANLSGEFNYLAGDKA